MNLMYAGKLNRPVGVDAADPVPLPVHNPLPIAMQVKWVSGAYYKNLDVAKFYVTIKSDLTMADNVAEVQLSNEGSPNPFTVVNNDLGRLDCEVPSEYMSLLEVSVLYYIDIEVIDNGVPYTILYDTIRPFQPVTKSVT